MNRGDWLGAASVGVQAFSRLVFGEQSHSEVGFELLDLSELHDTNA